MGAENLMDAGRDDRIGLSIVARRALTLGIRLSF
jgi:hypothetical protein